MWRSILSVIVGNVVWTILWLGFNAILANFYPEIMDGQTRLENVPLLLLLLGFSLINSILAGYMTAWVAQRREVNHALILGLLQLALGIFFQSQSWSLLPLWYHLSFLVLLMPGNILGGYLRLRQKRQTLQPV